MTRQAMHIRRSIPIILSLHYPPLVVPQGLQNARLVIISHAVIGRGKHCRNLVNQISWVINWMFPGSSLPVPTSPSISVGANIGRPKNKLHSILQHLGIFAGGMMETRQTCTGESARRFATFQSSPMFKPRSQHADSVAPSS